MNLLSSSAFCSISHRAARHQHRWMAAFRRSCRQRHRGARWGSRIGISPVALPVHTTFHAGCTHCHSAHGAVTGQGQPLLTDSYATRATTWMPQFCSLCDLAHLRTHGHSVTWLHRRKSRTKALQPGLHMRDLKTAKVVVYRAHRTENTTFIIEH